MRTLFDQLLADGEVGIEKLVTERQQESVSLEFKRKANDKTGSLDAEERRTLAKALSAFSNSAGGLLIYGVRAVKGPDNIDCAQATKRIAEIERFQSEVITATGQLLQPRHDGIEVRSIASAHEPGAGYLLILVDRSERRPHRSEATGQKQYFKRAGDNSFEMEHYDIEDAFRRFTTPTLEVVPRFSDGWLDGNGRIQKGRLEFCLLNKSSVTAKMPYLQIRGHYSSEASNPPLGIVRQAEGEWYSHFGDVSTVVHPGLIRAMVAFDINFEWGPSSLNKIGGLPPHQWGFAVDCRFGCENLAASEATIEVTERDLARLRQR